MWDNQRAGVSTEWNNPSLASLSLVLAHGIHLPPSFLVISAALRCSLPNTPVPVVGLWTWLRQAGRDVFVVVGPADPTAPKFSAFLQFSS